MIPIRDRGDTVSPGELRYDERGLLPVVVQDVASGAVLMLAWADREAVTRTVTTGEGHFWSRSRRKLWRKGETSGNVLRVVEVLADCDRDALLVRALPAGPACHRETRSCFEPNPARLELGWLHGVLEERREQPPETSYTARLLARGPARIAQKVGEEATETVVAALAPAELGDGPGHARELTAETADLLYHLLVLLLSRDVAPEEVARELAGRHWKTGEGAPGGPEGETEGETP